MAMELATADNASTGVASRWHQLFPVLSESEIARVQRFGSILHFEHGARLYTAGEAAPGMFVAAVAQIHRYLATEQPAPRTKLLQSAQQVVS